MSCFHFLMHRSHEEQWEQKERNPHAQRHAKAVAGLWVDHGADTLPPAAIIPQFLQTYIWQDYDLAPNFPEMRGFLKFWQETLDGPLHSVRYVHRRLISATEWRVGEGREFILH